MFVGATVVFTPNVEPDAELTGRRGIGEPGRFRDARSSLVTEYGLRGGTNGRHVRLIEIVELGGVGKEEVIRSSNPSSNCPIVVKDGAVEPDRSA